MKMNEEIYKLSSDIKQFILIWFITLFVGAWLYTMTINTKLEKIIHTQQIFVDLIENAEKKSKESS